MHQNQATMEKERLTAVEQLEQLRITPTAAIPPHTFLFEWNGTPCFARGELVAVTGKAKSGKTYLNSILMSAASATSQGNRVVEGMKVENITGHFLGLKRISEKPLRVVWIDTEQSEDSTCEILRDRIGTMIGEVPNTEYFHVFNLRRISWKERMLLVLSAIATCAPDLVIFDGIRDVVGDINNYEEAQNIIGQLLAAASELKPCIVCVLHQNKAIEDKTLRGALGSELQNKSFETYECSKDGETRVFTVKQTATRKYDMPNSIRFCLSSEGLPVGCAAVEENTGLTPRAQNKEGFNSAYVGADGKIDKERLFGYILSGNKHMSLAQLRQVVMKVANVQSFNFAFRLIEEARLRGLLRLVENDGNDYYEFSSSTRF